MRLHTLIIGASLLASSSAWAECQQSPMNWRYQNETEQVILSGTRAGTCRLNGPRLAQGRLRKSHSSLGRRKARLRLRHPVSFIVRGATLIARTAFQCEFAATIEQAAAVRR